MPNPESMLLQLFTGVQVQMQNQIPAYNKLSAGLTVTADDNVTLLSPDLTAAYTAYPNPQSSGAIIMIKKHPYPQETTEGVGVAVPTILIGGNTRNRGTYKTTFGLGAGIISVTIEVRILARDWTQGEYGFIVTGDLVRRKLVDSIMDMVRVNNTNPDGTGNFHHILMDPTLMQDSDLPLGTPLYRTLLGVECTWLR